MLRPYDHDGAEVRSLFSIEAATSAGFDLLLESRGGAQREDGNARNEGYAIGFRLLLGRLSKLAVTLDHARIASQPFAHYSAEAQQLTLAGVTTPILLSEANTEAIQRSIQSAASRYGQKAGATGGNRTKRVRLVLKWPRPTPLREEEVERVLARRELTPSLARSRYRPIGEFLWRQLGRSVRPTIAELGQLVELPKEALTAQFWANAPDHQYPRRGQWLSLGYRAFYRPGVGSVAFVGPIGAADLLLPTADPTELYERASEALDLINDLPVPPDAEGPTPSVIVQSRSFVRRPDVVAFALQQANGVCECCGHPSPFQRSDGTPYLEVHHVRPLAEGGPDDTSNAAAICPTCHRQLHHGADAAGLRVSLIARVNRLIDHPVKSGTGSGCAG